MDSRLQILAKRLTMGKIGTGSDLMQRLAQVDQARVIELALDYAAYRQSPRFGRGEQNAATVSSLLKARSRLDVTDQTPTVPVPAVWPGDGHKPARASIGYGIEDSRQFIEFAASPGYHDIMDPEGGFRRGAQVNVLNTALRYYPEDGKIELERIDIIDIMSLSSWNRFLHPVSWKAALGVGRKHPAPSDTPLMGRLNGGIGISHDLSRHLRQDPPEKKETGAEEVSVGGMHPIVERCREPGPEGALVSVREMCDGES